MAQRPLIGTSPNQVSTNGMLGDLAFQDSTGAYIETIRGAVNLDKLDKEITDTAVDIFVYDTRKDSDGGAWRKRTQHTSWYNETLNTATRGARREFPAVAVIVATATNVTIYDGDDPDMPMWMVFTGTTIWNQGLYYSGGGSRCIFALNGIISWGDNPGAFGIVTVNFINEFCVSRTNNLTYGGFSNIPLINRNSTTAATFASNTYTHTAGTIASVIVNDVAMTVLPSAPIDPATGLPIPTIAVATAGGVSVINDDGNVVDYQGFNPTQLVEICSNSVFGSAVPGNGYNYIYKTDIMTGDAAYNAEIVAGGTNYYMNSLVGGTIPQLRYIGIDDLAVNPSDKTLYRAGSAGFDIIREGPTVSSAHAILPIAYVTSEYNTGYMVGDIKGAFLSDTDDTDVTGTELWPEGDFADANEWPSAGAEWTISGGTATVSDGDGGYSFLSSSTGTLTNGKKYVLSFTVSNYSGGRLEASQANSSNIQIPFSANGSYSQLINYTGTTGSGLGMYGYGGGAVGFTLDNLYLRELEEQDRSVNANGLAVYGTITKSAVATGADLVAYSGFSDGDYLKQPHNSSLEFGTGSFSCTVWFKSSTADVSNYKGLVYLNQNGILGEGFQILLDPSNGIYFYIYGPTNDFSGTSQYGYNDGNWHQISVSSTGTQQKVYIDGVLKETGNITTGSITDTSSELFIGKWYGNTSSPFYWRGSIALCRISGSIPSSEQIKKIYEDEKVLFQENAKCTLYGSSDAVTALAYDEVNDLLHVGTSSGRSDFNGLRRINNTTTAVTTAISAYDGLIAAQ